jgi:hypothetical protein
VTTKQIIARALQTVGVLFSAAGGFLTGIAPPDSVIGGTSTPFAVGMATFAGAVLLLIISALTTARFPQSFRTFWLLSGIGLFVCFLALGVRYPGELSRLTFLYPEDVPDKSRYINGTVLTDSAAAARDAYQGRHGFEPSKAKLVAGFEGIQHINRVWVEESIRRAERTLLVDYLLLVLSLMGAIFSLIEGTLQQPDGSPKKKMKPKQ